MVTLHRGSSAKVLPARLMSLSYGQGVALLCMAHHLVCQGRTPHLPPGIC